MKTINKTKHAKILNIAKMVSIIGVFFLLIGYANSQNQTNSTNSSNETIITELIPDDVEPYAAQASGITPNGIDLDTLQLEFRDLDAYYEFANNADDSLALHNGINNGATFNGNKASFNGNDYIDTTYNRGTFTQKTLNAWVYSTSSADTSKYISGSTTGTGNADKTNFQIRDKNGVIKFDVRSSDETSAGITGSTQITNGWHMITVVFSGSEIQLYVDGVLEGSSSFNKPLDLQYDLYIGAVNDKNNIHSYFEGDIRDVAIWDSALSAQAISNLYNNNMEFDDLFEDSLLDKPTGIAQIKNNLIANLTSVSIEENASVYIEYQNGTTVDTTFDILASSGSKRYLINYGEQSYQTINGIGSSLNVLQLIQTNANSIQSQIQTLIQ